MNKSFKIIGYTVLSVLVLAYLAFLFVLPRKLDLNVFKSDIQKLVSEQAHMNIDFSNAKIVTTPIPMIGVANVFSSFPMEVDVGGATIFVTDVEKFEKI